ncbi:MAG: GNAT family N-acetyltransferase [Chthonomonas sp.]|nr:GNAT family N-acetyltransferase [Chthonomonas sp.]
MIQVRPMVADDIPGVVALQRLCFPPPFRVDQLWTVEHLTSHLGIFAPGQFVAIDEGTILGSASAALVCEQVWNEHRSWEGTLVSFYLEGHDPTGTTLYGADISVHPLSRGKGVGRALYHARFNLVQKLGIARFGTGCRLPGLKASGLDPEVYISQVQANDRTDLTLTPLLRYGLTLHGVIENYMNDEESLNCAALLSYERS